MKNISLRLRGIAIVVVALAVALPVAAQPARAQPPQPNPWGWIVSLVQLLDGLGVEDIEDLEEFTDELVTAVAGVETDVLTHLEQRDVADIYSDVRFAVTATHFLEMGPFVAGPYIVRVHEAFIDTEEALRTTRHNDEALNAAGKALTVLGPLLEGAYVTVNAPEYKDNHLPVYRRGIDFLVNEMNPTCHRSSFPNSDIGSYSCEYGDIEIEASYSAGRYIVTGSPHVPAGTSFPGHIDEAFIEELVMRDTIKPTAEAIRDTLVDRGIQPAPPQ